jgi:nitroreductase
MELFETIQKRRSVKHYHSDEAMPESDFERLMCNVILSPTCYNIQNWRFVRVTNKELREQLKIAAWGQSQVTEASELIILCADNNAWNDRAERYWAQADEATQAILLPMIESFFLGKEQVQRDEAMKSCGIAAQTLMLAAKAMGYDTCAMSGYNNEEVAELIKLPANHAIAMMITIGKAKNPARPRGGQLALDKVLLCDTF